MAVTQETIDHLYKVEKFCADKIQWQTVGSSYPHYRFIVPVVSEDEELLKWIGYAQEKRGVRRFGFALTYKRKFVVRSWDLSKQHWSKTAQRYIKGIGRHKHYYLELDAPREVYEIEEGEIDISDHNQALPDFAKECNIKILTGYQHIML